MNRSNGREIDGEDARDFRSMLARHRLARLCRKHKVKSGKYVRSPNDRLHDHYGLIHLTRQTMGLPSAKA